MTVWWIYMMGLQAVDRIDGDLTARTSATVPMLSHAMWARVSVVWHRIYRTAAAIGVSMLFVATLNGGTVCFCLGIVCVCVCALICVWGVSVYMHFVWVGGWVCVCECACTYMCVGVWVCACTLCGWVDGCVCACASVCLCVFCVEWDESVCVSVRVKSICI